MTIQDAYAQAFKDLTTPRPLDEYHEDMGNVLWWKFPIMEAPYVGGPNDLGQEILIGTKAYTTINGEGKFLVPYQGAFSQRINVGGWPGYHTHWTPIPTVVAP